MAHVAIVIPNWNGRRWLPGCLGSIAAQTRPPDALIVVDNGSSDGSPELARRLAPAARVVELARNTGFAHAANRGIAAARELGADAVALVNTDVELAPDWLARMESALDAHPQAAAVASKMVDLADPSRLYDTGDVLRRDGACMQRGRFERDDGHHDEPGEVFAACAGAALYRCAPVLESGGFDERYFTYLEDVDLGLRLQLGGWRCRYEPRAVARHAGEGSAVNLDRAVSSWVERNTLLLVTRHFPVRWAPLVAYRQVAWGWHALRRGALGEQLRGAFAAAPLLRTMARERATLRRRAVVPIEAAVPAHPLSDRVESWRRRIGRERGSSVRGAARGAGGVSRRPGRP